MEATGFILGMVIGRLILGWYWSLAMLALGGLAGRWWLVVIAALAVALADQMLVVIRGYPWDFPLLAAQFIAAVLCGVVGGGARRVFAAWRGPKKPI